MAIPYQHLPVMTEEVIKLLNPSQGKVLVDCTLGGGGHTAAMLQNDKCQMSRCSLPLDRDSNSAKQTSETNVKSIGIDKDENAIKAAKTRLAQFKNIEYVHDNFSNIKKHVKEKVDGILFDLGVSSYQIDEAERGFSYQKDGPLDMRMDREGELTADELVNHWPAWELEKIFREYGQERFAKRISNRICAARPLKTTFELKNVVERAIPTWRKRESVARIFQALRVAVNSELTSLQKALNDAIELLSPGGRIAVISYHSLEDRIAKNTFRDSVRAGILKILTKKPLIPGSREIGQNPRAKSAKLRAAEKL